MHTLSFRNLTSINLTWKYINMTAQTYIERDSIVYNNKNWKCSCVEDGQTNSSIEWNCVQLLQIWNCGKKWTRYIVISKEQTNRRTYKTVFKNMIFMYTCGCMWDLKLSKEIRSKIRQDATAASLAFSPWLPLKQLIQLPCFPWLKSHAYDLISFLT